MSSNISLKILGTGTSQGVPVIGCRCDICLSDDPRDKRLRCSAYVTDGETSLLIDCGPDLRAQLLRAKITNIDAVLLTHEHNDHVAGMDDLRPINFLHRKHVPIYAEERVKKLVNRSFEYIFDDTYQYPGKPRLILNQMCIDPFEIGTIRIQPIRIMHGDLPILGFRFGDIAYLTDVKTIPEEEFFKLKNLDTLIISALHHSPHHSHMNLSEAITMVQRIQPRQTFFTHCSHRMGLTKEISGELPEGMNLAYDGLFIQV